MRSIASAPGTSAFIAASAAFATCIALGAAASRGSDSREGRAVAPTVEADFAPYLAVAHSMVVKRSIGAAPPEPLEGRRVFVTAWSPGHSPVRATGLGATLYESVMAASRDVAKASLEDVRVEVDVMTDVGPAQLGPRSFEPAADVGLHGYLAYGGPNGIGWVLPREIVDRHLVAPTKHSLDALLRYDEIRALLASRAGMSSGEAARMKTYRFGVREHVEGASLGEPALTLFRGMPPHAVDMSEGPLLAAVRAGADYIARATGDDGKLEYLYDPVADESGEGYSALRHAGAIYALMDAYEEFRVPLWEDKAKRAIAYLKRFLVTTPDGTYVKGSEGQEQGKVGGAGLALVAMVKYAEATGDTTDLETMRSFARFIVHQQYPDGHFRENTDVAREDGAQGESVRKEIWYYAGEAVLGLVRLHGIDPDDRWKRGAVAGADYLVHVRDADVGLDQQIPDHWLSYALADLYALTGDPSYSAHASKIARAILRAETRAPNAERPDSIGSFSPAGQTTPTSTRLEATVAALRTARAAGSDDASLERGAIEMACFTRGQQIDAESAFFAPNPEKAIGGVRESLGSSDVRIDYVQHAVSGWLGLARELRAGFRR